MFLNNFFTVICFVQLFIQNCGKTVILIWNKIHNPALIKHHPEPKQPIFMLKKKVVVSYKYQVVP